MSEYFPKPKYLGTSVKDLSNYGTKTFKTCNFC